MKKHTPLFIGKNELNFSQKKCIESKMVSIGGDSYYQIANVNCMPPFFMSIVSDSNHWLFVSSNGGLTAGRKNAEFALFPYYTDDKVTESAENTGSKTLFWVIRKEKTAFWEPFSIRYEGVYQIERNLYKSIHGNKIIFEETNHDLGVSFRYEWASSDKFGFVKKSSLQNFLNENCRVSVLDGFQNIMPAGIPCDLQSTTSCLTDAYKRSELIAETGIGIFALSAIITDKAEPSEALKANVVWSRGLKNPTYLLSTRQLNNFRNGFSMIQEEDIKGEKGAYFICADFEMKQQTAKNWMTIANVNQTQSEVIALSELLKNDSSLDTQILDDIESGNKNLVRLVASADGLQHTADMLRNARHFSNTMFNIMRGGVFDNNYNIEKQDFSRYLQKANCQVFEAHAENLRKLPEIFTLTELENACNQSTDAGFIRLCVEYMPLKFSRRHGDPSRPWNKFSINTRNENGSKVLDYEGNWRDIFQNWEALSYSYPEFIESMIAKFLNASTFDGYNPYRVTKGGFDWETIEPDNPWSFIGYWGDHQIIYLLKLLEIMETHKSGKLSNMLNDKSFVYANVPYKIKSYADILANPKDTIVFDFQLDTEIRKKKEQLGADGALLQAQDNEIYTVTFFEKILAITLAKLSNFVPEGGIWMNTQRPEWNDANNALVGNGISMVTLYYLRRFLNFFKLVLDESTLSDVRISEELECFYTSIYNTFVEYRPLLNGKINDSQRKNILDRLGNAGSNYRDQIYRAKFSGVVKTIPLAEIKDFLAVAMEYMEHSIDANRRTDNLYHGYNLLTINGKNGISISHLSEMLEGQVAVLNSGYLKSEEVIRLLDSMKQSKLYRADQNSYLLYPNKNLPKFLEKNNIAEASVAKSKLFQALLADGNRQIIEKDINGNYHFNAKFRNSRELKEGLSEISEQKYADLAKKETDLILRIYEEVFNHKAFTGRSGTFFGYEGLGSIYWHMVSKLQLIVGECCQRAIAQGESNEIIALLESHYYDIMEGTGVHKSPAVYGAFTTDPYSHTPAGKGAKQPGMTGQVKEDIISRFIELGVSVQNGKIAFNPKMLRKEEFLTENQIFEFVDVAGNWQKIELEKDSLAFTYCQVPVVYKISDKNVLEICMSNGSSKKFNTSVLDEESSAQIFKRQGLIDKIVVQINH